jgi:sporulation protein YlmC with PRC-barrel domain
MAIRASEVIGKDVINPRGEGLGEVRDLVLGMNDNRVQYALLDMQGKHFAYPMRLLGWSADRSDVVLQVAEDRLERAPGLNRRLWERRSDRPLIGDDEANRYWSDVDRYWRDSAQADRTANAQPGADRPLVWASELLDWNVHDQANTQSIGEIEEIVVRPADGTVQFVAVDFNESIGGADAALWDQRLHPLPLDAFALRDGRDDLVLKTDRSKLQASAGFTDEALVRGLRDRSFIAKAARYADQLTPSSTTVSRRSD